MTETFLQIDNILGESVDAAGGGPPHIDDIEVADWSWGLTNDAPLGLKSSEASTKTRADDISVTKGIDRASATLMKYLALGTEIPKAVITCRKNTGYEKLEYLVVEFKKVKIQDIKWTSQGHEHGGINETVKIKFAEFKVKYRMQKNRGHGGGTVEFGFDVPHHKPT